MTTRSATAQLDTMTVSKSVSRCPNEGIFLIKSVKSLSVSMSGSCQCGSFFNLDPLKRGGRFDGIDEFESKERKLGDVLTLVLTPPGEMLGREKTGSGKFPEPVKGWARKRWVRI